MVSDRYVAIVAGLYDWRVTGRGQTSGNPGADLRRRDRLHHGQQHPAALARGGRGVLEGEEYQATGSVKRAVVPRPSSLSSQRRPPWASTSARAMAKPRPLPPWVRVRALSAR
jgi:hypothetical protein